MSEHTNSENAQMQSPSDLFIYLQMERIKSVSITPYQLTDSIRVWLREYEQQAEFAGINNMDECVRALGQYMPTVIRNWLATVPVNIKRSWSLFKEHIILQFGQPLDIEAKSLLNQLKRLKQAKNESIRLHSAKWLHLLSLLEGIQLSEDQKCMLYIRSLYSSSLRATLAANTIFQLDQLIQQSIRISEGAALDFLETEITTSDNVSYKVRQKVLLFNTQPSSQRKPRKLALDWYGPWKITKKSSPTRLTLQHCSSGKMAKNVHISLVKPFFE